MKKTTTPHLLTARLMGAAFVLLLVVAGTVPLAGATDNPWSSWRHDTHNTGAATDSGYPTTPKLLWEQVREPEMPDGTPARCSTPLSVNGDIIMSTGHGGRVEARDQKTGELLWTHMYTWGPLPEPPPDAPPDWCQGSSPTLLTNTGMCAYTIDGKCPDWCFACSDTPNDCSGNTPNVGGQLISPLHFPPEYGVFCAAPTIDLNEGSASEGRVYFGTMDGRFFCLDLQTGNQIWQKEPWKEPGGPNEGRAWYDQKFAWHLSPPSIAGDKMFFGSFLPSFYWVFKAMPFILDKGQPTMGWPSFDRDYKQYWVGRDGWAYCADKKNGDILWGWDPGGCGVTNLPPVAGGLVFFNADTVVDYHYGQMAACDITTGEKIWHVGPVPSAQGGNPAISESRNTIYWPEGDGAVWATDYTRTTPGPEGPTAHVNWTYHGGFQQYGATGVASSLAIDEKRGWLIGASDTGHIFVLDMDTGEPIRRTYLGLPDWQPEDGQPDSGYFFPGASAASIVPEQGILYIAGTDFESAWQGSSSQGKEKLFCLDYASPGKTLKQLWEYQFKAEDGEEHLIKGHDPYQISFYSLCTPALADGHVYYGSYNGRIYCFGEPYGADNSSICPAVLLAEGDTQTVESLRAFRSRVLLNTDWGRRCVRLFYRHAGELASLLKKNPSLLSSASDMLSLWLPDIREASPQTGRALVADMLDQADSLVQELLENAGPGLRGDFEKMRRELSAGKSL